MPAPDFIHPSRSADPVKAALVTLEEVSEYLGQRADADCDQDGFIPNAEMRLQTEVDEAIYLLERVIAARAVEVAK